MLENRVWTCAPQVKDLPRDLEIEVTCTCCTARRAMLVRDMVETQRLGAQFMDLLEWQARCEACDGEVRFDYDGRPEVAPKPKVLTLPRVKLPERAAWPVKAVVKRRAFSPQYSLPMALPAVTNRRVTPGRARAVS